MFTITIRYTLKVWLTSVLTAPLIYFIIGYYLHEIFWPVERYSILGGFELYLLYVVMEAIFSFPTWVVFLLTTWAAFAWVKPIGRGIAITILVAVVLSITTFMLILLPDMNVANEFFPLMMSNAATIGLGAWFYRPKLKLTRKSSEE